MDRYSEVVCEGKSIHFEEYNESLDRWFDVHASPLGGNRFAAVFTNITERKNTEEELRHVNERLNIASEAAMIRIWDWNIKADSIQWNPIMFEIFRIDPENSVASFEAWNKVLRHDDVEISHKRIEEAIKRHTFLNNEYRIVRPDGEIRWIDALGKTDYDGEGNPLWMTGICIDITERKKAEEAIARSQKLLQDLIDGFPSSIFIKDVEGRFVAVNNKLEELLGVKNEELKGKTDYDIITKELADDYRVNDRRVLEEGRAITFEEEADLIDGHHFFIANKFHLYDHNSNLYGVGSFSTDITERKLLEKKLKESHENLEENVEERTAELGESYIALNENELKLKDTILELERSNKELQSFAFITSHDLQEPLRTIASFAQLIERRYKGKLDPEADEFIEFMVDGASRMKEMIQGLLDYSHFGTRVGEFKEFNSEDALNTALVNLKSAIEESKAGVTHDPLPKIIGDESQISRVFQNFIVNAIKFKKPQFSPRIHISTKKDSQRKEWVFSVEDNGIGLEEQYSERIFEVFKRLHAIGEYQGVGIGLAVVKRIIEYHSGHVWVKSELGVGSTFYFTLPIKNSS